MLIIRRYDGAEPEFAVLIFPRNMHFNVLKTYFLIWAQNKKKNQSTQTHNMEPPFPAFLFCVE